MNNHSLEDVAQEFVMSKYATQQDLREAMLQEIVGLRNKLAEAEREFELYMEQY